MVNIFQSFALDNYGEKILMAVPDQVFTSLRAVTFSRYIEYGGNQYRWIHSEDARNYDGTPGGVLREDPPLTVVEEVDGSSHKQGWITNHWEQERLLQDVLDEVERDG